MPSKTEGKNKFVQSNFFIFNPLNLESKGWRTYSDDLLDMIFKLHLPL